MFGWLRNNWKTVVVVAVATVVFVAVTAATGGLGAPALAALAAGGFSSGVAGYVTQQLLDGQPVRPVDALKAGVVSGVITVATAGVGRVVAPLVTRATPAALTRAAQAVPAAVRTVATDSAAGAAAGGATQVGVNLASDRPWDENLGTAVVVGAVAAPAARPLTNTLGTPIAATAGRLRGALPVPPVRGRAPRPRTEPPPGSREATPGADPATPPGVATRGKPTAEKGIAQLLDNEIAGNPASRPGAEPPSRPVRQPGATPGDEGTTPPRERPGNRPLGDEPVFGANGFEAPLGTSPRAGDFTGLRGATIPEILARIPANAKLRELTPSTTGGAQRGREYSWNDGKHTWRVRIHDADGTAPAGSNARDGWVVRVQRGKQYMDDAGTFHHHQSHNPASPHYNPAAADATHIPLSGNPNL